MSQFPTPEEMGLLRLLKDQEKLLLDTLAEIMKLPGGSLRGREVALARTKIEEGLMWAEKALRK